MFSFYIPLLFFVLFVPHNSLYKYYHLNLSEPLNIINSPEVDQYLFYFEINPFEIYRVTLISNKAIFDIYNKNVYTYECIQNIYSCYSKGLIESENIQDENTKILFTISTNNVINNNLICLFTLKYIKDIGHLYINVDIEKDYYVPLLQMKEFYNIKESSKYKYYIIGAQRFQRIYINITTNSSEYYPFYKDYLLEYKNRTDKNYIKKQYSHNDVTEIYYDDEGNKLMYLCFDIDLGSDIALVLQFRFSFDYMTIYAKTEGGAIIFESNNITKTLTIMKRKNPYYFFTKATQYQVSNITLISKYKNNIHPFKSVDIYEYEDKNEKEVQKKEEKKLTFIRLNKEQIITSFIYKTDTLEINDIAFKFFPEYDLENVEAKINIKELTYFLNDGEIKTVKVIYSGCELYFWIKIKIFQKLKINLRFNNSSNKIPIKYLEFYEFYYHSAENNNYYNFINNTIISDIKNNQELFKSFIFTIENPKTNYALIKIKPEAFLENLEINANIIGQKYNLENTIPKNITNIKEYNPYYFFIEANNYNKLYIQINISEENLDHFEYITINEYENMNNLSYIKSTNITSDIIKKGINSNDNFIYIPKSHLTKYISLVLETNKTLNHLIIKIDVGGGYYEFSQSINITNIIKENIYYFWLKISPFKKMQMHIIMNDNKIKKTPFNYLNIYETKDKEESTYFKYFNQTLLNDRKKGQIIKYFSYTVDYFDTNYILIKIIPEINLKYMQLNYIIDNGIYDLKDGNLKNITKLKPDVPYYYIIKSKQYQQVNINFTTNYYNSYNNPFDLTEIFEVEDNHSIKSYNKYTYESLTFLNDNNNNNLLISTFSYNIDSVNTQYIIIKIKPKYELDYLDIKFDVGGGFFVIAKGSINNITHLFSKYSYYLFTLSSIGDKLNFKLSMSSNETEKPFNSIDIYEYSNKNSPLTYLDKTDEKDIIFNKEDKLITSFSYLTKNNSTNFIALKITPKYNISSIECLIELEPKKETQKISLVMILSIVLIVIFIGTTIIIGIYIKKYCSKASSDSIENIYLNKEKINEKKFELSLLSADPLSSSN